jgi:hypothetical protein
LLEKLGIILNFAIKNYQTSRTESNKLQNMLEGLIHCAATKYAGISDSLRPSDLDSLQK